MNTENTIIKTIGVLVIFCFLWQGLTFADSSGLVLENLTNGEVFPVGQDKNQREDFVSLDKMQAQKESQDNELNRQILLQNNITNQGSNSSLEVIAGQGIIITTSGELIITGELIVDELLIVNNNVILNGSDLNLDINNISTGMITLGNISANSINLDTTNLGGTIILGNISANSIDLNTNIISTGTIILGNSSENSINLDTTNLGGTITLTAISEISIKNNLSNTVKDSSDTGKYLVSSKITNTESPSTLKTKADSLNALNQSYYKTRFKLGNLASPKEDLDKFSLETKIRFSLADISTTRFIIKDMLDKILTDLYAQSSYGYDLGSAIDIKTNDESKGANQNRLNTHKSILESYNEISNQLTQESILPEENKPLLDLNSSYQANLKLLEALKEKSYLSAGFTQQ